MPRYPRNYNHTTFFHIITQGINKSYIFTKAEDIQYYIKTMKRLLLEQDIRIIAYCIMNNHAHFLLEVKEISELSKYMQRLNVKYALYYNKKYKRVGYVFRNRYKAEKIDNEEHLYACIQYIYDNPVKARLCVRPEDYPYSNYKKIDKIVIGDYAIMYEKIENQENVKEIITKILEKNNLEIEEIKKNNKKLQEFVVILKDRYGISLRKIAESLELGREKIRELYNSQADNQ